MDLNKMEEKRSARLALIQRYADGGVRFVDEYTAYIEGQCKLLTDFVDAAFGNGTCNAMLGPKTSLDGLLDVVDALREAVAAQGQQAGERLAAYMPNRATHEEK